MNADDLLRVYLDPSEITPKSSSAYAGYPRAWWNPTWVSEHVRHPTWVEKHGPVETVVSTWPQTRHKEPNPSATEPGALLSVVELPPIKDLIRGRDGHRCLRCGHPYRSGEHGDGEWSPCDEHCTHGGPMRVDGSSEVDYLGPDPEDMDGESWGPSGREAQWRILTVHHLNGVKHDCRWWNLVSLCQRCHLSVQSRVVMERPYNRPHSEWFRPFAAAFYAWAYLGEELTREEADGRLDELLALELTQERLPGC